MKTVIGIILLALLFLSMFIGFVFLFYFVAGLKLAVAIIVVLAIIAGTIILGHLLRLIIWLIFDV